MAEDKSRGAVSFLEGVLPAELRQITERRTITPPAPPSLNTAVPPAVRDAQNVSALGLAFSGGRHPQRHVQPRRDTSARRTGAAVGTSTICRRCRAAATSAPGCTASSRVSTRRQTVSLARSEVLRPGQQDAADGHPAATGAARDRSDRLPPEIQQLPHAEDGTVLHRHLGHGGDLDPQRAAQSADPGAGRCRAGRRRDAARAPAPAAVPRQRRSGLQLVVGPARASWDSSPPSS